MNPTETRSPWTRTVETRAAAPLARLLGISSRTWQRWLAAGIVPGTYRMGRAWRIEKAVASALLARELTIDVRGLTKKRPAAE